MANSNQKTEAEVASKGDDKVTPVHVVNVGTRRRTLLLPAGPSPNRPTTQDTTKPLSFNPGEVVKVDFANAAERALFMKTIRRESVRASEDLFFDEDPGKLPRPLPAASEAAKRAREREAAEAGKARDAAAKAAQG